MDASSVDIVVYHAPCSDGLCAAATAFLCDETIDFIPFDHQKHQETMTKLFTIRNKTILFLDCAPPSMEDYVELHKNNKAIYILDHHFGNQKIFSQIPTAVFDLDKSGCMLAWELFFPDQRMPELYEFIGMRDLGDFSPDYERVGLALMNLRQDRDDEIRWFVELLRDEHHMNLLLVLGDTLLREIQLKMDNDVKMTRKTIDGLEYAIVEMKDFKYTSEIANRIEGADVVMLTYPNGNGQYKVSLRTVNKEIDVSEIAKRYFNGNGHKQAAGGMVSTLEPFVYIPFV